MRARDTAWRAYVVTLTAAVVGCGGGGGGSPKASSGGGGGGIGSGGSPSGGGSQTAGAAPTAGAAGSVPHEFTPCPTDATGTVGVWENVTPAQVPLLSKETDGAWGVLVSPQNPSIVYLGTSKGGIYRSSDCAATWNKVNTGTNGAGLDTGVSWSMAIDKDDPNLIFSNSGYGASSLWRSSNAGKDWTDLFPMGSDVDKYVPYRFASVLSMEPDNSKHLVLSFHAGCTAPYAPTCLAESIDGGDHWTLTVGPKEVGSFEGAGPVALAPMTWLYALPFDGIWLTKDSGKSYKNVTPQGATGAHFQLYRSAKAYYLGSLQGVLRSTDKGETWELIPNSGAVLQPVIGDGKTLFTSQQNGGRFYTASEDNPTVWTELMDAPGLPSPDARQGHGAFVLAYDNDHHILYASMAAAGLFRVVTY